MVPVDDGWGERTGLLASSVTAELTAADVEVGWTALQERVEYQQFRPLADAASRLIADAQAERRIFTGIVPLDNEMRGISAGHLALVVGYSHSGKTLVLLHIIGHNQAKRICYFVPDEPAPLVLMKLACLSWGVSGGELESRITDGDPWGLNVLDRTIEQYSNLAVFDRSLTPRAMAQGYDEACDHWGAPADLVIVDYMDLLQAGDSVMGKADYVKSFGTSREVPMLVAHQTSRTADRRARRCASTRAATAGRPTPPSRSVCGAVEPRFTPSSRSCRNVSARTAWVQRSHVVVGARGLDPPVHVDVEPDEEQTTIGSPGRPDRLRDELGDRWADPAVRAPAGTVQPDARWEMRPCARCQRWFTTNVDTALCEPCWVELGQMSFEETGEWSWVDPEDREFERSED